MTGNCISRNKHIELFYSILFYSVSLYCVLSYRIFSYDTDDKCVQSTTRYDTTRSNCHVHNSSTSWPTCCFFFQFSFCILHFSFSFFIFRLFLVITFMFQSTLTRSSTRLNSMAKRGAASFREDMQSCYPFIRQRLSEDRYWVAFSLLLTVVGVRLPLVYSIPVSLTRPLPHSFIHCPFVITTSIVFMALCTTPRSCGPSRTFHELHRASQKRS